MTTPDWTVDARDEGTHAPGPELMWNESWYADFVTTDGSFGGYLRVGLSPNQRSTWFLLALTGPGLPIVRIDDQKAPLPDRALEIRTGGYAFAVETTEELRTWRVHGEGQGESFPDPTGILRGEPGAACELALDLTWATDGEPYRYPVGTRYEIPCLVEGTVSIGGQVHHVTAAVGQRDHSWGVRDWEGARWCWSASRLDDGTRTHLTAIHLPGLSLDLGYVQHGGTTVPVETAEVEDVLDADGLPTSSRLVLRPSGDGPEVALEVRVLAHAPTTIPTRSGVPQPFLRSMAGFRTPDGREGLGWIEWNGAVTGPTSEESA